MKYFGTDGFRGCANVGLTADYAYKIGQYVGWYYSAGGQEEARVVVGRDTRRSSAMFEAAIVAGLTSCGASAYLLDVTTTPSVSYVTGEGNFDAGVMITASHNPYYDNGIKLVNQDGSKMEPEVLQKIEDYIDGLVEITFAEGEHIGEVVDYKEGKQLYLDHLRRVASGLDLSGMRIGLDCANGASSPIAAAAFEGLGAEIVVINAEPDGFNINVDCGSTHINQLEELVRLEGLDCGFAFDGDADRCIAVDSLGQEVNGDKILYMCGVNLAKQGKLAHNMVVATVMANIGFNKAIEDAGLICEHTDVGDKYVYASMVNNGYVLGGEQSGHVIFSDCENTGDGIVTALKVLHALQDEGKTMTEFAAEMQEFPQLLVNVTVSDKEAAMTDERVLEACRQAEEELGSDGRILVRASGTEPLVRVLVEAPTDELCELYCEKVASVLREL